MMKRLLLIAIMTAHTVFALAQEKQPVIEPFYSVAGGGLLQRFIGNTAGINEFDAIFVTTRSMLPEDRMGRQLNAKVLHYYAEVFVRKSMEPQSISIYGLPLQTGQMIRLNDENYQQYKTPYHFFKLTELIKGPDWFVDWAETDQDYGIHRYNSRDFMFPYLYRQPEQVLRATKVNMPAAFSDHYQYDVHGNQEMKAVLEEGLLSRSPFLKPAGGYFVLGGYKYSGWSILSKLVQPEIGDYAYIVPSGTTLLTAESNKQEKCYSIFRTFISFVQEVKPGIGGRQRWLFVNISEHIVPVKLEFSPGSGFVD